MGSVGDGLGFYHIDLPDYESTGWLNISNCVVVSIKKGRYLCQSWRRNYQKYFARTGHGM
jgi:hypothetical protein